MQLSRVMKTIAASLALILPLVLLLEAPASAQSAENKFTKARDNRNRSTVSVISGGISGTYIRFATDLANVLDDLETNDMRVLPIAGRGGGQNVLDVLFLKGIDMGITQQDHLTFFKQQDPSLYGNIDRHIRYITKLYNAEFHLVAGRGINSFDDLRGKKVNLWKPWSATDIGGQTIFGLLGMDVEITHYDTQLALEKVKSGELAATSLLAGAPVGGFAKLKAEDGLHFISVNPGTPEYAKLLQVYLPSALKHEDYPGLIPQGQTVPTVASGAVLAVYNWPEDSERYRKMSRFVDKFFNNFKEFQKEPRHPKWRSINLAAEVPGWTRFKPAQEWLAKNTAAPNSDIKVAFNRFLNSFEEKTGTRNISQDQKDKLYEEFVRWWNTQPR